MLVLSRKKDQRIVIGEGESAIVLTVVFVDRRTGRVRLGLTAPRSLPIFRSELLPIAPRPEPRKE